MTQEKTFIQNRNGQKIVVLVDHVENPKGLAFVIHGLSGTKDQPHIQMFAEVFAQHNIRVVRFDTRNTFGESDGQYEYATATNYIEDLETVIEWSKTQLWYQEPFFLLGHSLGGLTVLHYAEQQPQCVRGVVAVSSVISGQANMAMEQERNPGVLEEWEKTGWHIKESVSRPGTVRKLSWSFIEDLTQYDVITRASALVMPVCILVGSADARHIDDQYTLLQSLRNNGTCELHTIENADHDFTREGNLSDLRAISNAWIQKQL